MRDEMKMIDFGGISLPFFSLIPPFLENVKVPIIVSSDVKAISVSKESA